jgi:hypothetical protein
MAKLKPKKYPKKPKASASVEVKKRYIDKVKTIEKENADREKRNKESERLSKVIAGIGKR